MKSFEEVTPQNMGNILNHRNLLLRTAKAFLEAIQKEPGTVTFATAKTFFDLQDAVKEVEAAQ